MKVSFGGIEILLEGGAVKEEAYFKVLKTDLTSIGLLGAVPMQYKIGEYNTPKEDVSDDKRKGGGLWVAPTLSAARNLQRYVLKTRGFETRVFKCRIGRIIYRTSGRVKTVMVYFEKDDEIK